MSATVDHLRVDHRITIIREFTDAAGTTLRVGESGILRSLSLDTKAMQIHLEIERESGKASLRFPFAAATGPRNGHMREFFALGDDVSVPRSLPGRRAPGPRTMIIPPSENSAAHTCGPVPAEAPGPDGRLKEAEAAIQQSVQHIGATASIAEMYAERMRAFQRAGDEPRAIEAFKLAVDWMRTCASQATSGGEGAALSAECDRFHQSLAREFGYDPTGTLG